MLKPYAQLRSQMSTDAQRQAEDTARALLDADAALVARRAYEAYMQIVAPELERPNMWHHLPEQVRLAWAVVVDTVRQHDRDQATWHVTNDHRQALLARPLEDDA